MKTIVMGVSGCGKSAVAKGIAAAFGADFLDADDYHPQANKDKMAAGIPLDDADRAPWLERLRDELAARPAVVLACSALKRRYRDVLRRAGRDGQPVRFVFLDGSYDLIHGRMAARAGHFMKPGMLKSQFDALEAPTAAEADVLKVDIAPPLPQVIEAAVTGLHPSAAGAAFHGSFHLCDGAPERTITRPELEAHLETVLAHILSRSPKKILLLPPDHTRLYSLAGQISAFLYPRLLAAGVEVSVMPTLGTHNPMTPAQCQLMFGDAIPHEKVLPHRWREDLVTLGELPAEFMRTISGGRFDQTLPVQVNKILVEGGFDLVISPGQVVPHEVIGLANYTKNVCVGLGGRDTIHRSHFLGAVCNMETIMGRVDTPVRAALDEAFNRFLAPRLPVLFILTVMQDTPQGVLQRGLFAGYDRSGYEKAAALSVKVNFTQVPAPFRRCAVWLDPREFHTTWLGNKAVYRTRMAMADDGELLVLAPSVHGFGEDPQIDALIRRHGYHGTPATLEAMKRDPELAGNLSAAAHLIHGSSEGRFRITYCTDPAHGGLSQQEVESVGFAWRNLPEVLAELKVDAHLPDGPHLDRHHQPFHFIRNPALGLWAYGPFMNR